MLEEFVSARAGNALDSLAKLLPDRVTVRRDGEDRVVPLEEVQSANLVSLLRDRNFGQVDILHNGPNDGQTTGFRRKSINLIGALSNIAKKALNGVHDIALFVDQTTLTERRGEQGGNRRQHSIMPSGDNQINFRHSTDTQILDQATPSIFVFLCTGP
jgi:hypothetical protein